MKNYAFTTRTASLISLIVLLLGGIVGKILFKSPLRFWGAIPTSVAAADNGDWTYVEHDLNGTRYSPLSQITPQNVQQIAKVCSYTFPEKAPSESAPIVSSGILYVTSQHYVVALDGSDCRTLWSYRWAARDRESPHANRGAAIADGKIIRGTADDYLIAIDAKTGFLLWAKQIAKPGAGYFISMPPLVQGHLIYIGPAGSELAASGWVGAFRLSDGEQVWKFNIVPADGEPGEETWGPDPEARKHGGGALWTPLSYDTDTGLLYVPGGNPAPDFYDDGRPGANLYTNSIIALYGKTGRLAWYKQLISHDVHDYDITHVNPIFKIGSHTAIATSGKDGMLRVVNPDTHKILYSVPFTTRINAAAPASFTPIRICPGTLGGSLWNGAAFSPKLNLLLIPSIDNWCQVIQKAAGPPSAREANSGEGSYIGGTKTNPPFTEATGRLTAFDASTGKARWRYNSPAPLVAAVTLTGSNLAFTGDIGGYFCAFDAETGKVLLRLKLNDSIRGGVVTYLAGGAQFVALVSGNDNPTVTVIALRRK